MLETRHKLFFTDSRRIDMIASESIDLIVTSPPYPMISMWDDVFFSMNDSIRKHIEDNEGSMAFEEMHLELDPVWEEAFRILKPGGFACINIGDAVRTIGGNFRLYPNHSRLLQKCMRIGFNIMPLILWWKPTNAPNKFMGSGMLPSGAYVTLEHEYILIMRKNGKRNFTTDAEKMNRRRSSCFWEERNTWFSDVWDFKGAKQNFNSSSENIRKRSAAFPFELAHRLINMYSCKRDIVLDPFAGTGTTIIAALGSCRNSIGIEIDEDFCTVIRDNIMNAKSSLNDLVSGRLIGHKIFIEEYKKAKAEPKHANNFYKFPVITGQETDIILHYIREIKQNDEASFTAEYDENPYIMEKDINLEFEF